MAALISRGSREIKEVSSEIIIYILVAIYTRISYYSNLIANSRNCTIWGPIGDICDDMTCSSNCRSE